MTAPLLSVEDLTVRLPVASGRAAAVHRADAVHRVSFDVESGATLGIVGESGSGKSLTALALMGLTPEQAEVSGRVVFEGRDLSGADENAWARLRGDRLAMIFQEPMTALNPLHTVARQVGEPLRIHRGAPASAAQAEAVRLLDQVGLPGAARAGAYPHELSGGQRQRVTVAMALACAPALLIADEPTTALDATTRGEILDLIAGAVAARRMALLMISHDLEAVAETVARILVMYGGTVVESGPAGALFARPAHPYTRALLAARPRLGAGKRRTPSIPGTVPSLADLPAGCRFAGRCPLAVEACRAAVPPFVAVGVDHAARCIRLDAAADLR